MFRIKVNLPNCSGTISTHSENHIFDNLEQVRTYLNNNYFHGLDLVKHNTMYSLTSRPKTLKNCAYKDFISIEKVNKKDTKKSN